jgi:DNA-binding transcriptional MerR regulator
MASTTPRTPLKLRIGELAQRTGRSVHTIRWYEQQGLLPPVPRLGTHRLYSNRHVEWLELMDRLRLSGMPIAELRRYTALAQRGGANLEATRAVLLAHRERVDAQIAQWKQARKLVDAKIAFIRNGWRRGRGRGGGERKRHYLWGHGFARQGGLQSRLLQQGHHMRFIVPSVLILVAAIHALPVMGVIGAAKLSQLYGITVQDPNLELLLRHRAVLFGLLAAFLAYAAVRPELHRIALVAGFVSVVSFLVLAEPTSSLNTALVTVVRADCLALALLVVGTIAHFRVPVTIPPKPASTAPSHF